MSRQPRKHKPDLLLIGPMPPSTCPAAAQTVEAALLLSHHYTVTVCIDDTVPAAEKTEDLPFSVIRRRELSCKQNTYTDHKRLYVVGDSYECLYALELYENAPAPVLIAEPRLNRLVMARYAVRPGWPGTYGGYLVDQMGDDGLMIARGLMQHRRHSDALMDEVFTAEELLEDSANPLGLAPEHCLFTHSCPVLSMPVKESPSKTKTLRIACNSGALLDQVQAVLKTLTGAIASVEFVPVFAGDPECAQKVAGADMVIETSASAAITPLAAHAVYQNKLLITASQRWATAITRPELSLPGGSALHRLVAILGALVSHSELRTKLHASLPHALGAHFSESRQHLLKALNAPQTALLLPAVSKPAGAQPTTTERTMLKPGPARSIALIGAIPPRQLVTETFPEVDWETSPRFATPQVAAILCGDDPEHAPNKLALLGYDSPLIATTENTTETRAHLWPSVQTDLKNTQEILTFGCQIEGAACADHLLNQQHAGESREKPPGRYRLALAFQTPKWEKESSFYEKDCGLFWKLDRVQHRVDCMLVAGLRGNYRLSGDTLLGPMLVADKHSTQTLTAGHFVQIKADNHGILFFTLRALETESHTPLSHEVLMKRLADSTLNLEWLGHG